MRFFFIKLFFVFIVANLLLMPVFGAQDGRYAAIVIDESSGQVLHAENADSIRHPASLAKKMTLYILFKALRNKQISLNTRFTTSYLATQQIPCKLGLKVGDTIDVRSIIEALITISSNDVAIVVAEGLAGSLKKFVALMNKTAKELGLKNTRFYNPSGVPDARQITTARDMATLGMALYHRFPEYYPYFKKKHIHYHGVLRRAHNHMLESFPNSDGLKTGFVNASGFNITTSAFRYDQNNRKRRLFVVVMGGQSWRSRDQRAALLLEEGFRKINATNLGPSSPLKPSPKSKARSDDASPHLQAVSYSTTKEAFDRNLRQVSQDSSPPTMPPSAVNNAQLLDASLKKTVYEDKPRAVKGASNFPNIIQPIHSPANETAKLRPVSYSFSPEDEAQRTLPPGWVKASAPHTPKKVMAKVHLKKRA